MQLFKGQLRPGHYLVDRAQGRFHHAAGDAENVGRAGAQSQGGVELALGQVHKVDAALLDHPGQLPGGQHRVHVADFVHLHLGSLNLILLGRAGHHGHHEHILGLRPGFFRVEGLDHRAHHGVRALAGGQVVQLARELVLNVLDPARGTAGNHGQRGLAARERRVQTAEQLRALLQDGQVCGEQGVEHVVKADLMERRCHFPGHRGAAGKAELLAQSGADRGGHLDDDPLAGIGQCLPNRRQTVRLLERSRGTDHGALTAHGAGRGV